MDSQTRINLGLPLAPAGLVPSQDCISKLLLSSSVAGKQDQAEDSDSNSSDQDDTEGDAKSMGKLSTSSKKIKKEAASKREKYNVIANDVRLELIDCVINKGEKIKRAAARLGINYSSAKSIFQVYKKEGRSDKKSSKRNKTKQGSTDKISPKQNFASIPPTHHASDSSPLDDQKSATAEFINNPFIEKLKAYETLLQPYPNGFATLNIQKSESVPNFNPCGLEFSRNLSVGNDLTNESPAKGFSLFSSLSTSSNVKPKNNFLSSNSAFSKFPRKISSTSLENQSLDQENAGGNKNINNEKTSTQLFKPNQSFQPYKQNEDRAPANPLKNWTNEDKQDLMRALRYLTPEPNMLGLENKSFPSIKSQE